MKKSYSENRTYYRQLIAQMNKEVNFPAYLHSLGYKLLKKSAGSLEFENGEDRIVLNTRRSPISYFNRNDSTDKGLFFAFIRKLQPNFYKAIEVGLESINCTYILENNFPVSAKRSDTTKTLEENYTITSLLKMDYLIRNRNIAESTLKDELFRGRIFNAFHVKYSGRKIGNIAFAKYDLEGKPKNYTLYNKPYFDRKENRQRKFRLTLNKQDHFLFYSKPLLHPKKIIFGESAIDLISYHELHGNPTNFYVAFGGNVYPKKLSFFLQLTERYLGNKQPAFISIMDNDMAGRKFELMVFAALVNQYNPKISIAFSFRHDSVGLSIQYLASYSRRIPEGKNILENILTANFGDEVLTHGLVKIIAFSDKLVLEFPLDGLATTSLFPEKDNNVFMVLLQTMGKLYLPFTFGLHHSKGKDWNDDLRKTKQGKYVAKAQMVPTSFGIGDKVGLKSKFGPKNTKNVGIIIAIKEKGVLCDFGLKHSYLIPYSSIRTHFQKVGSKSLKRQRTKQTKSNNTLLK